MPAVYTAPVVLANPPWADQDLLSMYVGIIVMKSVLYILPTHFMYQTCFECFFFTSSFVQFLRLIVECIFSSAV